MHKAKIFIATFALDSEFTSMSSEARPCHWAFNSCPGSRLRKLCKNEFSTPETGQKSDEEELPMWHKQGLKRRRL